MHLTVEELLRYTEEERERWERWFFSNGEELLSMPIAGDRDPSVGALILHIFGPELRYVQRLREEPLTEYRGLPCERITELFGFGIESRKQLRAWVENSEPNDWERVIELDIAGRHYSATIRKIVLHIWCMRFAIGRKSPGPCVSAALCLPGIMIC